MMHEYFWWGANVGDLLFSGLSVKNATAMILTCLVFVILTVLFEGFKVLQSKVRRDHNTRMRRAMQGICAENRTNLLRRAVTGISGSDQNTTTASEVLKIKSILIASQVLLYTTNTGINYLIMLVVMMYNGYLVMAIILGTTLGYFLFGYISVKYKMDQIKEKAEVVTVCVPECEEPGCQLKEPDGNMTKITVDPDHPNEAEGFKTQLDGSTSLRCSDASQTNLNNFEVHSDAQHLSDQEAGVGKQARDADCCQSSKAKKTTDISEIKTSKDADLVSKCCDKDTSRDDDETSGESSERDIVKIVSEKKKPCCDKNKRDEDKKVGVCARHSKNKSNLDANTK